MSWWLNIIEYLRNPENGGGNNGLNLRKIITHAIAESAVDLLYYALGFFTSLYYLVAIYLFFFESGVYHEIFGRIFDALVEPYLGSVGIYVILKEVRKRQLKTTSRHFGEFFVFSWLTLFLLSLVLMWFSPGFKFDDMAGSIMTITLALTVIYMGGLVHRP